MLRRLIIVAALLTASPASASMWIHCSDTGGAASFDYLAGDSSDVLTVSAVTITLGEKVWASDPANGPGDPVSVGQVFGNAQMVLIDALDKDLAPLAQLRLFKAMEGDTTVYSGVLDVPGYGAWAMSCDPDT